MAKGRGHNWLMWKCGGRNSTTSINKPLCLHCGLLWLSNEASNRAARSPCTGRDEDS